MIAKFEFKSISMLNRIRQAENLDNLRVLTLEGLQYKYVSDKTRKRWNKATNIRQKELFKDKEKPKSKLVGETHKNRAEKKRMK